MKQRLCECLRRFLDSEILKARQISLANDKPLPSTFLNISYFIICATFDKNYV